jgi:hypothetical protein
MHVQLDITQQHITYTSAAAIRPSAELRGGCCVYVRLGILKNNMQH